MCLRRQKILTLMECCLDHKLCPTSLKSLYGQSVIMCECPVFTPLSSGLTVLPSKSGSSPTHHTMSFTVHEHTPQTSCSRLYSLPHDKDDKTHQKFHITPCIASFTSTRKGDEIWTRDEASRSQNRRVKELPECNLEPRE